MQPDYPEQDDSLPLSVARWIDAVCTVSGSVGAARVCGASPISGETTEGIASPPEPGAVDGSL